MWFTLVWTNRQEGVGHMWFTSVWIQWAGGCKAHVIYLSMDPIGRRMFGELDGQLQKAPLMQQRWGWTHGKATHCLQTWDVSIYPESEQSHLSFTVMNSWHLYPEKLLSPLKCRRGNSHQNLSHKQLVSIVCPTMPFLWMGIKSPHICFKVKNIWSPYSTLTPKLSF